MISATPSTPSWCQLRQTSLFSGSRWILLWEPRSPATAPATRWLSTVLVGSTESPSSTCADTGGGYASTLLTQSPWPYCRLAPKSTRLNSSHLVISYAVFCLKKKNNNNKINDKYLY